MDNLFATLWQTGINQIFPHECVNCGKESPWLCSDCEPTALKIKTPTCPFCDKISPLGKTCPKCKPTYRLTGARSIFYYKSPAKELVHALKYRHLTAAQEYITPQLALLLTELPLPKAGNVIITSVPLTPERLRDRGYNQSEILAQAIAKQTKRTYMPLLKRKGDVASQTRLTRKERLENVQNQFSLRSKANVTRSYIIVIDDVITTGATLASCAAELKEAGARQVWGLTVAKD